MHIHKTNEIYTTLIYSPVVSLIPVLDTLATYVYLKRSPIKNNGKYVPGWGSYMKEIGILIVLLWVKVTDFGFIRSKMAACGKFKSGNLLRLLFKCYISLVR